MLRGGSWYNDPDNCRCAYRNDNHPDNRNNNIGFRVVFVARAPEILNQTVGTVRARIGGVQSLSCGSVIRYPKIKKEGADW